MDLGSQLPYIGAEVYISDVPLVIPVPGSFLMVYMGLLSLWFRYRREYCRH